MNSDSELSRIPQSTIMDPVHGGIPVYSHELQVIDHPLFQRLNHIRQNDLLFLVFPGATHTRFSHSVGTMHLAGKLYSAIATSYLSKIHSEDKIEISKDCVTASHYINLCVRIAALLHDTGHGPFSHLFEHSNSVKQFLEQEHLIDKLWGNIDWTKYCEPGEKLSHEDYSIRCAYEILSTVSNDENFPVEMCDVLSIMEGAKINPSQKLINHAKCLQDIIKTRVKKLNQNLNFVQSYNLDEQKLAHEILVFCQKLISGEVDADKMDYLLRDSFFSGCQYGAYNLDHLINSFSLGFDLTNSKKPWIGLLVKDKGVSAIENFVHSRFQLYMNLYSHKTVVGFKWLFSRALEELLNVPLVFERITSSLAQLDKFEIFTDEFLWEELRRYSTAHRGSACDKFLQRKPLEYLKTLKNISEFEKQNNLNEMQEIKNSRVIYEEAPAKFSEFSDSKFEAIRLEINNRVENKVVQLSVTRKSDFFLKFRDCRLTHFYVSPFDEPQSESEPLSAQV